MQSSDVFQVGDAVDSTKCFFQSLHDDGRDCLAGDKAAGLVSQNPGDTSEQKANGHRGCAVCPIDMEEAGSDDAGRRQADAYQGSRILEQHGEQGGIFRALMKAHSRVGRPRTTRLYSR